MKTKIYKAIGLYADTQKESDFLDKIMDEFFKHNFKRWISHHGESIIFAEEEK